MIDFNKLREPLKPREHNQRNFEYQDYLEKCDDMLDDLDYEFAWDTIQGIRKNISNYCNITENQKRAIDNIYNSISENQRDYDTEIF